MDPFVGVQMPIHTPYDKTDSKYIQHIYTYEYHSFDNDMWQSYFGSTVAFLFMTTVHRRLIDDKALRPSYTSLSSGPREAQGREGRTRLAIGPTSGSERGHRERNGFPQSQARPKHAAAQEVPGNTHEIR